VSPNLKPPRRGNGSSLQDMRMEAVGQVVRMAHELCGEKVRVYLFGSVARGESRSFSDLDSAIDAGGALAPGLLSELRRRLEDSTIPYTVDLVDLATASSDFRQRVLAEGILWTA